MKVLDNLNFIMFPCLFLWEHLQGIVILIFVYIGKTISLKPMFFPFYTIVQSDCNHTSLWWHNKQVTVLVTNNLPEKYWTTHHCLYQQDEKKMAKKNIHHQHKLSNKCCGVLQYSSTQRRWFSISICINPLIQTLPNKHLPHLLGIFSPELLRTRSPTNLEALVERGRMTEW